MLRHSSLVMIFSDLLGEVEPVLQSFADCVTADMT